LQEKLTILKYEDNPKDPKTQEDQMLERAMQEKVRPLYTKAARLLYQMP
jgi:hypothetical protein